ncbi:FecR domain-containing protein [Siphonobacter sp. SORGH_AS_0500]|uniref:FecR family protein n=1 Tax=Siphonobacter sp. SORGH_AS_0500 TaxID=1864824 RepID=UPI002861706D|nr:FecR domain-containing protein [Siphonobacter sp. SORGH_AS_0500]MDR6197478.1 transmembrane sensor [Siphonobacter sp. SORGH_AS_0500]
MEHYQAEDFAAEASFIAYYLKSDPEAVAFWEHWIRTHPEKLDEIVAAENLLDLLALRLPTEEFEQEKERMRQYLDTPVIPHIQRSSRKPWLAAASVLLILGLVGGLLYFNRSNPSVPPAKVEWVHHSNPNGKKTRLTLSDGSTVILNAASTIHYPKTFHSNVREIRLEGEAFFSVAHDSTKPFIVQTGELSTSVLGTEFNVSAYSPANQVTVSLHRGKVQVENALRQRLVLMPGQQAIFQTTTQKLTRTSFDSLAVSGWKDGYLVFKNADFKTVAQAIERMYGYEIILKNPNPTWHYTGSFYREEMQRVIENISFSKHLTYTIHHRKIYLSAEK